MSCRVRTKEARRRVGVPAKSSQGISTTVKVKLRRSDDTLTSVVLLEMIRHPSALDDTLPGKKGNDNILKSAPPMDMRN